MKMSFKSRASILIATLTALVGLGIAASAAASPSSHFSSGIENWYAPQNFFGVSAVEDPDYHSNGGHPGGYISVADADASTGEQIAALTNDSKFEGNFASRYGAKLSFDLRSHATSVSRKVTVYLVSFSGNNPSVLVGQLSKPNSSWKHFSIPLKTQNWTKYPGKSHPTKAKFTSVLKNLSDVSIQADYSTAPNETTDLDDVSIGQKPKHHHH